MKTLAALLLVLGSVTGAGAQNWVIQGAERFFQVEWASTPKGGGVTIDGYIHNVSGTAAEHVRLLVESVDAGGAVTEQTLRFVPGVVNNNSRTYFIVQAPA